MKNKINNIKLIHTEKNIKKIEEAHTNDDVIMKKLNEIQRKIDQQNIGGHNDC